MRRALANIVGIEEELDSDRDLHYRLNDISPRRRAIDSAIIVFVDNLAGFAARHWIAVLNIANGVILLGAFVNPLLYELGQAWMAGPLFASYRVLCVQNPDHSYFIFGYQMAMDQRMTAIFGSIFATGVIFAVAGKNARPLNWRLYLLFLVPIALDGFTQLFGWRHSNWQLRTVTGILFGVANVWLAYPQLQRYVTIACGRDGEACLGIVRAGSGNK